MSGKGDVESGPWEAPRREKGLTHCKGELEVMVLCWLAGWGGCWRNGRLQSYGGVADNGQCPG